MGVTASIFVKKDYVARDGTVPIYLRITINRKVKPPIAIGQRVDLKFWDDIKRLVKKGYPNYDKINTDILKRLSQANDIIQKYKVIDRTLSYELFLKEMDGVDTYDFFVFTDEYISGLKKLFTKSYTDKVGFVVQKIKNYRSSLDINDIDYKFLKEYSSYLATTKGNCKNTIYSNMRIFRRILNEAIKEDIIKRNPFDKIRLEKVTVEHETIEVSELLKYEDLLRFNLPYYLRKTLCWFLLACYTGRRYQDIKEFYNWEFKEDYIRIVAQKGLRQRQEKKIVIVFLNDRIKKIVDIIRTSKYQPISNQKANSYLKEVTDLVGIQKNVTFHTARHTFATLNKKLKTDTHVNKELLGHDSINSTLIYEKVDNELLKEAMLKWNSL